MPTCKSCGAEIMWGVTEKGHRMPLDPEPSDNGNIRLEEDELLTYPVAKVLSGIALTAACLHHVPLYISHFATCPNAKSHRRRK